MDNTYLTTALIIAKIEMKEYPIPAMGLLDIHVELGQQGATRYYFTKVVKVADGSDVVIDSSLSLDIVDKAFTKERNRRIKKAVAERIIEIEIEKNGFHKISGASVGAFNINILKHKYSATIVLRDSAESNGVRYDKVEYPLNIIRLGNVK